VIESASLAALREHATLDEVWERAIEIGSRLRGGGDLVELADAIDDLARHLRPPKLEGIVAELAHPQMWATREHALQLAAWITDAARIICRLRDDAEITGSTATIADADAWLKSVGIPSKPVPGTDPPPDPPDDAPA